MEPSNWSSKLARLDMALRCLLIALMCSSAYTAPVDFVRDVRPILSNRCFKCHGPDIQTRDIRLDHREGALAVSDSAKRAIVPGDASASELIRRVTTEDPDRRMPPNGDALTSEEIAVLTSWIDAGADYAAHWADIRPVRPDVPVVQNTSWPTSEIDFFVLQELEKNGLSPAPEADRATLIRRVSLDVIGLPPSVAEVDAFLADDSPDAYGKVLDRLFGSPHFGERWARWWLDLARYGDTNGYEDDQPRPIWPYRDWVIAALNRNEPFDRFSTEQIAGDLLDAPSLESQVATGFHRNSLINTENGSKLDEWKDAANKDRIQTVFTTWLATTFECAQCHNHKFDPISQQEYYAAYAFFNSTTDIAGKRGDDVWLTDTVDVFFGDPKRLSAFESTEESAARALTQRSEQSDIEAGHLEWRAELAKQVEEGVLGWHPQSPDSLESRDGTLLELLDDLSVLSSGALPDLEEYTARFSSSLESVTAIRVEALTHESFTRKSLSRSDIGNFVLSGFEVEVRHAGDSSAEPVKISRALADYSQRAHDVALSIDGKSTTGWAVNGESKPENRRAVFVFEKPIRGGPDTEFTVRLKFDSPIHPRFSIGRFRLSLTRFSGEPNLDAGPPLAITRSVSRSVEDADIESEWKHFVQHTPLLSKERTALQRARSVVVDYRDEFTSATMVIKQGQYRPTHFQKRGNFLDPGDEVEPGVPSCYGLPLADSAAGRPSRLDLAAWIMHPDNPRTSRVTVNRVWDAVFGRGLVTTSEDFGVQGSLPSHPELLDWLATEFLRQQWNLKALLRTLVSSATYRQACVVDASKLQRDPDNVLLSRGARYRVEAEMVRDIQLVAGDLLTQRVGGPSAFPPQPPAIWEALFVAGGYKSWPESAGADRYRRGLYTYVKRTALHPVMRNFDATNRTTCLVRRGRSNTPLAALTTLNEKSSMEAAGGLAWGMVDLNEEDGPVARLVHGFRTCVARHPRDAEREALLRLYTRVVERYRNDPESASWLVESAFHNKPAQSRNTAELAAWIVVANTLLNMDATLSRF